MRILTNQFLKKELKIINNYKSKSNQCLNARITFFKAAVQWAVC